MEEEKIEILYQMLISGLNLTDSTLKSYEFTEDEISTLLTKRIIEKTTASNYKLFSVDKFRRYGVKLLLLGCAKEANICFRKCYELAPDCKNICLQLLLAAVVRGDYTEAFELFTKLKQIKPEKNILNNNLYLYLLSFITECPEEYTQEIQEFRYEDLMLPKSIGNRVENEIRLAIFKNKFTYAYQLINNRKKSQEGYSVKFELIRTLLIQAIGKEKEFKSHLLKLAQNEEYETIISLLRHRQQKRHLSKLETYILLITDALLAIMKTHVIPAPTINFTYSMYEALIGNNFKLALAINEDYLLLAKESSEDDIINILLLKINKLISNLQNPRNQISPSNSLMNSAVDKALEEEDQTLKDAEEMAYYLSSEHITIEAAIQTIGISKEQVQLVKLIYARDYYIEGMYKEGDELLKEVEDSSNKTQKVIDLLKKVRENKDNHKNKSNPHDSFLSRRLLPPKKEIVSS